MTRDRAERLALIEAAFRIANERMAAWEEASPRDPELYFCECSRLDCREKIPLTLEQYEAVRAEELHFFVIPGHEALDVEEVVAAGDGYLVVEKPETMGDHVRGTNPRRAEPGPVRADAEQLAADIAPEIPDAPTG